MRYIKSFRIIENSSKYGSVEIIPIDFGIQIFIFCVGYSLIGSPLRISYNSYEMPSGFSVCSLADS
jgi:hypothetical protein